MVKKLVFDIWIRMKITKKPGPLGIVAESGVVQRRAAESILWIGYGPCFQKNVQGVVVVVDDTQGQDGQALEDAEWVDISYKFIYHIFGWHG